MTDFDNSPLMLQPLHCIKKKSSWASERFSCRLNLKMQRGMLSTSSRGTAPLSPTQNTASLSHYHCVLSSAIVVSQLSRSHTQPIISLFVSLWGQEASLSNNFSPFFIRVLIFSLDFFSCYDIFYPLPSHPKERCSLYGWYRLSFFCRPALSGTSSF